MGTPVRSLSSRNVVLLTSGEPIEGGRIQVGERECSVPDGGRHPLEWHPGPLESLHPPGPTNITGRVHVTAAGFQDPELHQPVDVAWVDPGAIGDVLLRESGHDRAPRGAAAGTVDSSRISPRCAVTVGA